MHFHVFFFYNYLYTLTCALSSHIVSKCVVSDGGVFLLFIRIAKPSQVYFGGEVRGMSAMKTEEEVGSLVEYEFRVNAKDVLKNLSFEISLQVSLKSSVLNLRFYFLQVINLGKPMKSFGTVSLNIQWPKESSLGKWLLYLMKINTKDLQLVTCSPEREINPLRLNEVPNLLSSHLNACCQNCSKYYSRSRKNL